jgi:hypothetical protein
MGLPHGRSFSPAEKFRFSVKGVLEMVNLWSCGKGVFFWAQKKPLSRERAKFWARNFGFHVKGHFLRPEQVPFRERGVFYGKLFTHFT